MIEIIFGCILGAICSTLIAHFYYRKSSRDLSAEVLKLKGEVDGLKAVSQDITESLEIVGADTEKIKDHAIRGTPDDPEYPYK